MDFLIHLFAGSSFNPGFEAQAKNVLKNKHSLSLLSVSPPPPTPSPLPPAVIVCFDSLKHFYSREKGIQGEKAKDIRKAQIMRCQAGQTIIVNYIYSSAFGILP